MRVAENRYKKRGGSKGSEILIPVKYLFKTKFQLNTYFFNFK